MAMAKLSSIPVRKMTTNKNRPIIPTVISFILFSKDLHNIAEKHKALKKAAAPYSIDNRVERYMKGGRNLPRLMQFHPKNHEI
jgi:hypothetical protein